MSSFLTVWRNLGIALFNVKGDTNGAKAAFDRAMSANPNDGRVLYERDQLWKRTGDSPQRRLTELLLFPALLRQRDDLAVELATLFNQTGQPAEALNLLLNRFFQPWEGGEGLVLTQHVRARLLLGRSALAEANPEAALEHFPAALKAPPNLGEDRHLLANQSDLFFWLGTAYHALGEHGRAIAWWQRASRQLGDFRQMALRIISPMTYWTAMAKLRLGEPAEAEDLFQQIYDYSVELQNTNPKIDYFATSLPAMLLFEEDLVRRNMVDYLYLRSQAASGLGRRNEAEVLRREVLRLDSNHMGAADLLRHDTVASAGSR